MTAPADDAPATEHAAYVESLTAAFKEDPPGSNHFAITTAEHGEYMRAVHAHGAALIREEEGA